MEDRELVLLCHRGERAQYAHLVERHQRLIFGLALTLLKSYEEAEDVTQEAFLRTYRQIMRRSDIDFLPYVKRTATNLAIDKLRRRKKEREYLAMSQERDLIEEETPERLTVKGSEQARLRQALKTLPPMYEEVLVLSYVAELSYSRIADHLGLPLSIVKNRLYRGKRLLKDAYLNIQGGN